MTTTIPGPKVVQPSSTSRRRIAWLGIIAAALSMLVVSVVDRGGVENDTARIQRLSASYACPVCAGQSVAESNAEAATTIRQQIRTEVQAGSADDEIRDLLITQYGGEVLLNPPAEGVASLVWALPVIVIALGAAGVGAAVGGRRSLEGGASDQDKKIVNAARRKQAGLDGSDGVESKVAAAAEWGDPASVSDSDLSDSDLSDSDLSDLDSESEATDGLERDDDQKK